METGPVAARMPSMVVCGPQCEKSSKMPNDSMRATASRPSSVRPLSLGARTAGTDLVLHVVRRLDDAEAHLVEPVEPVQIVFERNTVLEAEDQAESTRRLRGSDLAHGGSDREHIGTPFGLCHPHRISAG